MPLRLLQAARIAALLGLLLLMGSPLQRTLLGARQFEHGQMWRQWLLLLLISGVFVVVALVGRDRWHPPAVLATEALIAVVLAVVPPFQWIMWFGLSWFVTRIGAATGLLSSVQPLSLAWLGIVVAAAVRQARSTRSAMP